MNHRITASALAAAALLASPLSHSATVQVRFVEPEKFADVGRGMHDRQAALDAIERHLKELGQRLPEGQTLTVEVTDIDLAGEMRWMRRGEDKRILRGRADWPRMNLKYTLASGTQQLKSGEERLADMAYLQRVGTLPAHSAYAYETRMIDDWFGKTFAAEIAAAASK